MDGGSNWELITNDFGSQTHFSDLEVSPHNSDIVMATMASGSFYLGEGLPMKEFGKARMVEIIGIRL